jgi:hypothetical protein
MKKRSAASLKKVTAENLSSLGAERLAELLVSVAATRPDLKRRLRMELAAEQGAEHLGAEIDKRLTSLLGSRGRISWRQRASFLRDLDALRDLIAGRLADLDHQAAVARLWAFMDLAPRLAARTADREGKLAEIFEQSARDLGRLLDGQASAAPALVSAIVSNPAGWAVWLPWVLGEAGRELAGASLALLSEQGRAFAHWATVVRRLAQAAENPDAYRSTFTAQALKDPVAVADVARQFLAAGRVEEAGEILRLAGSSAAKPTGGPVGPSWAEAWIEYLARSGDATAAQAARWSLFEQTLSVAILKAFTRQLEDFEDVEAEARAIAYASQHQDIRRGLGFLMEWPALFEAAQMIQARASEIDVDPEAAQLWAGKLRSRYPAASEILLRKAAAAAFRRRELVVSHRLTEEADAIAGC